MIKDRAASDRLVHDPAGGIDRLLEIMARLRDPSDGCPWDLEQDFATIAPYTIEEAYEVADAIERRAWGELEGELGDLLFQTIYHTQMAAETGHFTFESVTKAIADKMVARHPPVCGSASRDKTADAQTRERERLKRGDASKCEVEHWQNQCSAKRVGVKLNMEVRERLILNESESSINDCK